MGVVDALSWWGRAGMSRTEETEETVVWGTDWWRLDDEKKSKVVDGHIYYISSKSEQVSRMNHGPRSHRHPSKQATIANRWRRTAGDVLVPQGVLVEWMIVQNQKEFRSPFDLCSALGRSSHGVVRSLGWLGPTGFNVAHLAGSEGDTGRLGRYVCRSCGWPAA